MACDVSTLVAEAACFQCATEQEQEMAELALLCQILTAIEGGGGGGGAVQVYSAASPPAAPANPALGALYYPTGGGTTLQWDTGSLTWL